QRGQLRLAYVATRANTADIFTKALPPGDHQPCFALAVWPCDCQRELCVGPRPRLGGADFVVGCTGGTANLQQWATPT
ncbi:unnamed protein product, partial [Closterium sp. NIES-53]